MELFVFSNGSFSVASKERIIINCVLVMVQKEWIMSLSNFVPAFHLSNETQIQSIIFRNLVFLDYLENRDTQLLGNFCVYFVFNFTSFHRRLLTDVTTSNLSYFI